MSDHSPAVRLFSTDIDDTILGDPVAARQFMLAWNSLDPERRPLLVYNTGRSVADTKWLVLERRLPSPEFIIGGVGTEVHDPLDARAATEFGTSISPSWDRRAVEQIVDVVEGARRQSLDFSNPWKVSYHWSNATPAEIARLQTQLDRAALEVNVSYTGDVYLDVIPRRAGKGNALAWLCRRIGVSLHEVLVAGASGNNASMFALSGVRGILVGNASRDLFAAVNAFRPLVVSKQRAAGVLAGLGHFGVLAADIVTGGFPHDQVLANAERVK